MAPLYYRDADAALLVFDMTVKETLRKAEKWVEELKQFSGNKRLLLLLVGNKADKINEYEISQQGMERIKRY